jgi:iron(III) transport system ATP-binding protein
METLRFESVYKRYKKVVAVDGLNLSINAKGITAILGESGSGKTTVLRLAAGFEQPGSGSIYWGDKLLADGHHIVSPEKRNFGFVFQDLALFPHLTVNDNIRFAQSQKGASISELTRLLGISGLENRFPHELSGGQQQRVAIARAICAEPQLLFLDEPFSSLDHSIHTQVRRQVENVLREREVPALFVTHDLEDAMDIADQIVVMHHGKLIQVASPSELMQRPATHYVASLLGPINILQRLPSGEIIYIFSWESSLVNPENTQFKGRVDKSVLHEGKFRSYISGEDFTFVVDHPESVSPGQLVGIYPDQSKIKKSEV